MIAASLHQKTNVNFITKNYQTYNKTIIHRDQTIKIKAMPASLITEKIELLIVATKCQDTINALNNLKYKINSTCLILLCQNGTSTQHQVSQKFTENILIALSIHYGAKTVKENILHTTKNGHIYLGKIGNNHLEVSKIKELMKLLNSGYLNYSWSENIYTIMWQKLIINSLVNPLTVIYLSLIHI